ncbi:MAG TPA: RDD family protein, partial [Acidobacteriaceae bacterium]|nr:RDD family protein [Acidobacteriaceae bacterium]
FPRQLVAARKARPRLAEGPLREEISGHDEGQLRIFEVESAQISTEPVVEEAQAPQWTSIFLDAPRPAPAAAPEPAPPAASTAIGPPGAASVARRAAAAAINGSIVGLAAAAFAAAAMVTSGNVETLRSFSLGTAAHMLLSPDGRSLLGAAAIVAALLWTAYQALFFAFSTATPGMRCVRIGLCTFSDENPSRKRMRHRILAILLSAVPFGLGFIWAALDEEKLSWHDRVSGMYLRVY